MPHISSHSSEKKLIEKERVLIVEELEEKHLEIPNTKNLHML